MCTFLSERRFRMITSQFKNRYTHRGCVISPIVRTRFAHTCVRILLHAIILYEILVVKLLKHIYSGYDALYRSNLPPANPSNECRPTQHPSVFTGKHCRPPSHARCNLPTVHTKYTGRPLHQRHAAYLRATQMQPTTTAAAPSKVAVGRSPSMGQAHRMVRKGCTNCTWLTRGMPPSANP